MNRRDWMRDVLASAALAWGAPLCRLGLPALACAVPAWASVVTRMRDGTKSTVYEGDPPFNFEPDTWYQIRTEFSDMTAAVTLQVCGKGLGADPVDLMREFIPGLPKQSGPEP